jgi:hypothetical protein
MCCDWMWKTEEKVIVGCRGSEHVKQIKTLVAQKHTHVTLYTGRVQMRVVVSQGVCTRGLNY